MMQRTLNGHRSSVQAFAQAMQMLAPERVLERGYSIIEHNGAILRDSAKVRVGDDISVRLARGHIHAEVRVVPLASEER